MHIHYFSGTKIPSQSAQSVHCMKMAQAFAAAGHEVTLFAKGASGAVASEIQAEIFAAYDTPACFKLELTQVPIMPLLGRVGRLVDFSGRRRNMQPPDIAYGADVMALALLASSDTKILLEAHAMPEQPSGHRAMLRLLRAKRFCGVIAASAALKQEYLTHYPQLRPDDVFIAHDGASLAHDLNPKNLNSARLKGRSGAFKIGYIGTLHEGKGITIIAALAKERPDYDFHIVGGTEKHVQKYRSRYFTHNLHFYGHRNHADIPAYLAGFDVVLAPYQHPALIRTPDSTAQWLSPIKIFEYMAAGRAICASDLPILREILDHQRNAILLPAQDIKAWAQALDSLQADPALRATLGQQARAELIEKYTWDKRAAAIVRFANGTPEIFRHARAS